ncbi:uncharacterized protein METZ01_LOCUS282194, partial [marine metagenome]
MFLVLPDVLWFRTLHCDPIHNQDTSLPIQTSGDL